MNYRERMRKAIECPQFGNIDYGEWGTLRLDQRKNIKRLLDEMDRADIYIRHLYEEIDRLNNIIEELEKYIGQEWYCFDNESIEFKVARDVLDKLKELKENNNV